MGSLAGMVFEFECSGMVHVKKNVFGARAVWCVGHGASAMYSLSRRIYVLIMLWSTCLGSAALAIITLPY